MKRYTTDLIRALAKKYGRSQAHYTRALAEILSGVQEEVAAGHTLQLTDFGTFYTRKQAETNIRDVRSRKIITIPAHVRVAFRPGEQLKQAVAHAHPPTRPTAPPRLKRFLGIGRKRT